MRRKFKAVIFDLDGTLLNTIDDIGHAMNRTLEHMGHPSHPMEAYKTFVGDGVDILMQRALPDGYKSDEDIRRGIALFKEDFTKNWNCYTELYPGISELLNELIDREIPMAIHSNKPHELTLLAVEEILGDWEFDAVLGQSPAYPRKPDPAGARMITENLRILPEHFIFVGDSGIDMQTGRAAGMYPVGVAWGFRPVSELMEAGSMRILDHPSDLIQLMDLPA